MFKENSKIQLLVGCGGGGRPVDGLRQQHVHTIRLLVWDTLEDLPPSELHTWGRRQHVTRMHVDELVQHDGRA